MAAKGTPHLVARDVRCFTGFLNVHLELHYVEEELEEVLVLGIASLHGETKEGPLLLERDARRQRDTRALAWRNHVERILRLVHHKALHALAHPDPGPPRNARRDPAAAGRHGDSPAGFVRRLNRSGARPKLGFKLAVRGNG